MPRPRRCGRSQPTSAATASGTRRTPASRTGHQRPKREPRSGRRSRSWACRARRSGRSPRPMRRRTTVWTGEGPMGIVLGTKLELTPNGDVDDRVDLRQLRRRPAVRTDGRDCRRVRGEGRCRVAGEAEGPGGVACSDMCRLFGMSGGPDRVAAMFWLLEAPDSLSEQSRREPDGTGLGYYDEHDRPVVDKQPIAAFEDRAFAREARKVQLADVRGAHPVRLDRGKRAAEHASVRAAGAAARPQRRDREPAGARGRARRRDAGGPGRHRLGALLRADHA